MANQSQIKVLKKSVKAWNEWREMNPYSNPNLLGAKLGATNLAGAKLHSALLVDADFSGANLCGASLRQSRLDQAIFREADLRNADLSNAHLVRTEIDAANLSGANFGWAVFGSTILTGIDLSEVKGLESASHRGPSSIGIDTIYKSKGNIPEDFMRGCGVPEDMIAYARSLSGKQIEFYSCFISYSTLDSVFAERVHADLQRNGVRTWYFAEDAKWGETVWGEIDKGIKTYDKLVVLLSEHSLQSKPVLREVQRSLDREDKEHKNILFPITLDRYVFDKWEHERKVDVMEKVIGDFVGWDMDEEKYGKSFDRLLKELQHGS